MFLSENHNYDLLDNLRDVVLIVNKDCDTLFANRSFIKLCKIGKNDILGKKCYELWGECGKDDKQKEDKNIHFEIIDTIKNGSTCTFERRLADRYVKVTSTPIRGSDGHIVGAMEVGVDITWKKQAEDTVRQVAQEWQETFDAASESSIILDKHHEIPKANISTAKLLGSPLENGKQIASLNLLHEKLIAPDELDKKLQLITDGVVDIFDAFLCRIWLTRPGDLCEKGCIHLHVDKKEHLCRDTSESLHLMASSGLHSHVGSGDRRRVPMGCYKIGKIATGDSHKFISNDVVNDPEIHDHQWAKENKLVSFAGYRLVSKNGSTVGVLALYSKKRITAEIDGLLTGLANTTTHLILQAQVEHDLRMAYSLFENIFNASIPICITDLDHNVIKVNESYVTIFGPPELNGHSIKCYESRPGPSCQTERCPLFAIKEGAQKILCETSKDMANGEKQIFIVTARPFVDEDGTLCGIHESFQDITEHKKLENELTKMRNLESLGYLAGGIAHDFNNLMTAVIGNIELAQMFLPPGSKAFSFLKIAGDASERTKDLTNKLLTFSKGGFPRKENTDLLPLIEKYCHALIQYEKLREEDSCIAPPNKFTYDLQVAENLMQVSIDRQQIGSVLNHVLLNAMEAILPGGKISVSAKNITLSSGNNLGLKQGAYVLIAIHDNGRGIEEKKLPMVFNPYFSTKNLASQKGVGLGLALSLSIINKHKGHVTIDSIKGEGTTVSIYLPGIEPEREEIELIEEKVLDQTQKKSGKRGKILILEDEVIVAQVAETMLENLGYEHQWAEEGNKAIELYKNARENNSPFDTVIFDLTIKDGLGGKEAFEQLLSYDPDIKGIVASGYTDDPVIAHCQKYGFKAAICKPFDLKALRAALAKAL